MPKGANNILALGWALKKKPLTFFSDLKRGKSCESKEEESLADLCQSWSASLTTYSSCMYQQRLFPFHLKTIINKIEKTYILLRRMFPSFKEVTVSTHMHRLLKWILPFAKTSLRLKSVCREVKCQTRYEWQLCTYDRHAQSTELALRSHIQRQTAATAWYPGLRKRFMCASTRVLGIK